MYSLFIRLQMYDYAEGNGGCQIMRTVNLMKGEEEYDVETVGPELSRQSLNGRGDRI